MPTPTGQVRNSSRERSSNGNSKEDSVEATDSGQNNNQEEQETQEYNSSSEEESEYDEEEDEKKRMEYLEDMNCLEKYFSDLKEMLYHERMRDLELKQQSVFNETAPEYLEQLQELEKSLEQNHNAAREISLVCSPNSVFLTIVTDCSYLFQLLITVMPRTHWPLV
jgi:glutamine synthetase adenylyltransferase